MNFHQTPEEIINHATAEQRILWNHIFLRFGENVAIQQLYFLGPSAGIEFATYSANKMYLALSLAISGVSPASATLGEAAIYNEANVLSFIICENMPVWDTTAAALKYSQNAVHFGNILFSRITVSSLRIKFIGYRLSI